MNVQSDMSLLLNEDESDVMIHFLIRLSFLIKRQKISSYITKSIVNNTNLILKNEY